MKPRECTLLIFGLTVASVLDSACELRDLDVVELWSGIGSIVRAAEAAGFTAMPFDKFRIKGITDSDDPETTEDILLEAGFRRALSLVLRLRPGGLLWMAPVCSSWIFLNLKNTMRTKVRGPKFRGNLKYLPVRHGNLMAEMAAFLFLVAAARGVHAVIENPACSMMFSYEIFANACALWSERFWAVLHHCRFSDAPYGSRLGKKFKLMGSHSWVRQLACKCLCPGRKHKLLHKESRIQGKRTVTGLKQALKESAAYPAKMGIAIIDRWSKAKSAGSRSGSPARSAGPKSKARCSGPRSRDAARSAGPPSGSKARSTGLNKKQRKKTWLALDLDESLASSSSSSRAPVQQRSSWRALDLDDAIDLDGTVTPAEVQGPRPMTWRSLDVDESDDPPAQQHRWQSLSFDE